MVLVWREYRSDLGNIYPFLAVSARQINQVSTTYEALQFLTVGDAAQISEIKANCAVPDLTPRQLIIYAGDDAIFALNYNLPFDQALYDHLSALSSVRGFEFIGERIRYSRLTRMLANQQ